MDKQEYQNKSWYLENRVVREPCLDAIATTISGLLDFEILWKLSLLELYAERWANVNSWILWSQTVRFELTNTFVSLVVLTSKQSRLSLRDYRLQT